LSGGGVRKMEQPRRGLAW